MANNHGSKFVSINLNKSYGQHNNYYHTGSYGPAVGTNHRGGGGGGGGMVVLSRNHRPLQKATPKLSVPPPLNLPSLRKEFEKTDSSSAAAGGSGSGTGSRPSSSGMGWRTKPANTPLQEKEVGSEAKGSGAYMPPSARFGGDTLSVPVEKAMVLRGEDFPSLRAALPSSSQKQKEGSLQTMKKLVSEESSNDGRNTSSFNSPAHMKPSHRMVNDVDENLRPHRARLDHALKQEDPLSFLRLNPRSDWADDERDTGRSGRDQAFPKSEIYWDRDLDVPRSSILPQKPSSNLSERSQVLKAEPYRETNSWRSSIHKERPTGPHVMNERSNITGPNYFSNNNTHHGVGTENRDPAYVRRDPGVQRHWNHNVEYPRSRNEGYQNSTGSKSIFSVGGKSSFSKSERAYLDDSFQKDFSSNVYDETDPLTGNLVGVMKRKKGVIEQTAFHDPVRESFEAELERVQKMQEMERQRVVEEQERAQEQAKREDEDRRRVVLEEEERRRRMEEEARESAWRAEQERLEAIQKAEDQKIAREEEKRRMLLEEERRKQAAKQKLLDLEARMAKRGAGVGKTGADDEVSVGGNDGDRFSHLGGRDHRSNFLGVGESYGRNREIESEFHDNVGENYGEASWGQGHSRSSTHSYPDRLYMNSESDKLYSYGRSRFSIKQPHVLPPPSSSVLKSSVRGENKLSAPSSSLESTARTGNYGGGTRDNLQQEIMTENLDKKDTLRCDSQSSLSFSSPPGSPIHLSHDELDDSCGSVTPIRGEGKEVVNDEPGEVTTMAESKSVSADEDDDWNLEIHDEMQEQEEYDENDAYSEEDEVLEGPDGNGNLTQEFEDLQIEEKNTTNVMENFVVGFNEGVEVNIPGDEFDEDSKAVGYSVDVAEVSAGGLGKQAAVDAVVHEHEQPQNASISTSSGLLGDSVSSSVEMTYAPSSVQSPIPVKLQFGLFSGPTLIPSPVPAIQIGSIQMPLHFHQPPGLSMGHIHPSQQPPLFQFGQLNYSSPVSQGILPMTQQPVSLVQPNFHHTQTHFNLNQTSGSLLPNLLSQESSSISMKNDSASATLSKNQSNLYHAADNLIASKPVIQIEEKGHGTSNSDSQLRFAPASSRGLSAEKNVPSSKAPGPLNRGKRTMYPARSSGPRSFQAYEPMGSNEFQRKHRRPIQRTEFRVKEYTNNSGLDDKLHNKGMGTSSRSGYRRQTGSTTSHAAVVNSESRPERETSRTKTQTASSSVESNQKRDILEEDIDAPLQSGVVRVFKQPGIECLSDEDDFIEVRSKRQMLNDRREQREKEIKQPRKARLTSTSHKNKVSASFVSETSNKIRFDVGLVKKEHIVDFSTMASQPLAPFGTATVDPDVQTEIRGSVLSGAAEEHGSSCVFQTENETVEKVQTSLDDWGIAHSDEQVIPLTQIQLDEAMKPLSFNTTHISSIGDQTTLVNEPILPSSLTLTKGKAVASSSSPINSLLAGEKIQFGAVTSPTLLPPSSCVVSHGIGASGAFLSDITQTTHNILKAENDCNVSLGKGVHSTENCEAEPEASVAAIDTNEIVGNGLGRVSVSGTKGFGGAIEGIQGGKAGDQQPGSQSKPEESLSVSLPADLSVETPPISLWPPLPSPQGTSTPMLSHFHGPTPSHFPFYDMNHPMMSAPVFAFGSHDESGGPQAQSQQPTGSAGSRHIGAWQNRSGMDSIYGPPAGFTGPFIGSPGGIPGVQAPPHMVVYNHYSPVGQFGPVGLSFMGTTYIPSGKQPDWKHDPTSSSRNEDGMSSMNMASGPRNPPSMQPPIQQHLAPGSPVLPMGSPLTMFDVPPFQTAPDMSVQARWSHVPASSLQAVPMPPPLQKQAEVMTGPSVDQPTFPPGRLSEPQASGPSVAVVIPDELGLLESSGPSISTTSPPVTVSHSSSATTKVREGGGVESKNQHQHGENNNNNNNSNSINHGGDYGYQRGGGVSPKNKSTWSHRRIGRYMGAEKRTKVKQIYVAKQPTGSSSTVG